MSFAPFPTELLPRPLCTFISEAAEAIGVDEAYLALPLLAAAASAIGTTRQVRLKGTWTEPAVLWVALVAPSGNVKSAPLELAMQWIRQRQNTLFDAAAAAAAADAAARVTDDDDATFSEIVSGLSELDVPGNKPRPPVEHVFTTDITVEALADRLAKSPRGLMVAVDELASWFASFGRYKGTRSGDMAHWLSMHRAGPLKIDRKNPAKPTVWIPAAAVSVSGGIQPRVLRRLLRPEFFENGLAARLLLAMPPLKDKVWTEAEVGKPAIAAVGRLFEGLYALEPGADSRNAAVPLDITLDSAAKSAWIKFYNEHNREQRELGDTDLAAAFSKLEGYAARFALIIHCCRVVTKDGVKPLQLDAASLEAGVTLSRWFGGEARRVYDELAADPAERHLDELIEIITRNGGEITERQLCRSHPTYRKRGAATAALESLIGAGVAEWEYPHPTGSGGCPARRLHLHTACDRTPEIDIASGGSVTSGA